MGKKTTTEAENYKVYRCLDCSRYVLNEKGASSHASRSHKDYKLDDENFKHHFRWVKNPPAEILEKLLKQKSYGQKYRKQKNTPAKTPLAEIDQPALKPQVLGVVGQPEIVEDGIIFTLSFKVPIQLGKPVPYPGQS